MSSPVRPAAVRSSIVISSGPAALRRIQLSIASLTSSFVGGFAMASMISGIGSPSKYSLSQKRMKFCLSSSVSFAYAVGVVALFVRL